MTNADLSAACAAEVADLHAFFVAWFTGVLPNTDDAWTRAPQSMAPGFSLIAPSGDRYDRATLLAGIRGQHASHEAGAFQIWTKNFELCHATDELITVRYEEWQLRGGEERGRISSAVLVPDSEAPHGVRWLSVHETWLPGAGPSGA